MRSSVRGCVYLALVLAGALAGAITIPTPPDVGAGAYILMDARSGKVLAAKNADLPLPPASITKIMTSYVVAHELTDGRLQDSELARVSMAARAMQGSRTFLEVNSQVPVIDLLRGLIVQSGNDAAVALAEHISGSEQEFVQMMNSYASQLGMDNTLYANASGYPQENHYSTAHDQALLTRDMIAQFPEHYQLYSERSFTWNGIRQNNRNRLLWLDSSVDGVKTGHTEDAGYCLVASAARRGTRLISVVMQSESTTARDQASRELLNYGFRHYETRQAAKTQQQLGETDIWLGVKERVKVGFGEDYYALVPRRTRAAFEYDYSVERIVQAPLKVGDKLGTVSVKFADEQVATLDLVAVEPIAEAGWFDYALDYIGLFVYQLVYEQ